MRKLVREPLINAQDLAPHVPSAWRDAANEMLDINRDARNEVLRQLNDSRMRKFWNGFDDLVRSAHAAGCLGGGDVDRWLQEMRRSILLHLTAKGGARPKQTAGDMKRFRARIAKSIELLIAKLSLDPTMKRINIEDALYWTLARTTAYREPKPNIRQRRYVGEGGKYETAPKVLADSVPPFAQLRIIDVLGAFAERLRSGASLAWLDPIDVQRGASPRKHLEDDLSRNFAHLTNPLPAALFAPAIEVALNERKGNVVEVKKLNDRLRKFPTRKAKKNSGK